MTDRPNVIYILDDDHRAEQLGCMGHPIVETPHLDGLAADGTLFENAFCTSPACTPSRASHYLGEWERSHGQNFNGNEFTPATWDRSFPRRLQAAGYYTGWIGKNHVRVEDEYLSETFDYWYGNWGHSTFYPKRRDDIYKTADPDTQAEIFADAAVDFLDPEANHVEDERLPSRPTDRPFCLCVTFNLPHGASTNRMELCPSDDALYRSKYRDRFQEIPLPETYEAGIGSDRLPRDIYSDVRIPQYDYVREPTKLRENRVREYQTITGIDRAVGRIRSTLREQGIEDDTIIVFSSDHGIHHGEHGLGGKCFLYEEDLRIPMIVYDPRVPASARGQRRSEFALVPDLAPTMYDLTGVDAPSTVQGQSLRPLLEGDDPEWRDAFVAEQLLDWQNYPMSECLRTGKWKYVRYFDRTEDPDDDSWYRNAGADDYDERRGSTFESLEPVYEELFDLDADPNETTNLTAEPGYRGRIETMRDRLNDQLRDRYRDGTA